MTLNVKLIALIIIPLSITAAPKYPFPQKNPKYPFGIVPTTVDHAKVQKAYEDFMKLYEESSDGKLARIKHDQLDTTVSEGIAYGMILMVYMDNEQNNTQAKFDKLWAYYKKFSNKNGLMNWRIRNFSTVIGANSATDAELDAAVGLMQAYKQWGNDKYLNDARALIDSISKWEVNKNGLLTPGDSWDSQKNPSYFSTGALQLFKKVSTFDWDKVITNSYALLKKSQNATTGLVPNWCNENGDPIAPTSYDQNRGNYTYDATRTPWRVAWAHSWYGHQDAKDICTKIASWISTKTANKPDSIVDGYKLDGTETGGYNNATFVGPFACAGMVDAAHQEWLDKSFAHLAAMPEKVYYQVSLKILTLLYLSGNMPDFWTEATAVHDGKPVSVGKTTLLSKTVSLSEKAAISFSLSQNSMVDIRLHNLKGELVSVVARKVFASGNNAVTLSSSIPAGTYLVKMSTDAGVCSSRLSFVR